MRDKIPWGAKGAPVLPKVFEEAVEGVVLPGWASALAGLETPCAATVLCDPFEPGSSESLDVRLIKLGTQLAVTHVGQIESEPALKHGWDEALDPSKIPWSTRTYNCLEREGLLKDRTYLGRITIEELLAIPAMGIRSVLDFASTVEAAVKQNEIRFSKEAKYEQGDIAERIEYLLSVTQHAWPGQIHRRDPRFVHLMEGGFGTLASRIEAAIEGMEASEVIELYETVLEAEAICAEISSYSLEKALYNLFAKLAPDQEGRLHEIIQRFGWDGNKPLTLEECGQLIDVTRERVRQIQSKILKRIPSGGLFLPQLESAVRILENSAPVSADKAKALLQERGLSHRPFDPESVLAAAQDLQIPASLYVKKIRGERVVISDETERATSRLFSIARAQSGASGSTNVSEVVGQLSMEEGYEMSVAKAKSLLQSYDEVDFLGEEWFWVPEISEDRNRLRNVSRRMLSIASPISVSVLRAGIQRVYSFRNSAGNYKWTLLVPPASILTEWYRRHPEFVVGDDGGVTHRDQLDYRKELGEADQMVVDALRSSPSGLMDRAALRDMCFAKGVNPHTFEVTLSYSPVIDHVDTNIWALRGVVVDPAAVSAVQEMNSQRPKANRVLDYGWTDDGRIWISVIIPAHYHNAVFGIPSAISRMLKNQRFVAFTVSGQDVGRVSINSEGTAYGFQPFLKQAGAVEGDTFLLKFELESQSVTLHVGDDFSDANN